MNATIERIVNLLFEDLAESDEVAAIRDEILQNCQERYEDLREAGIGEDDAIHAVIESLNGMEEMLSAYPRKGTGPAAVETACQPELDGERSWSCDPSFSPIHEIRMEHMGRANVYVAGSEDDKVHVTCSNPKLTLMTGMENGILTVALSEEKMEDIKVSVEDLKDSLEKGFDLSSIGRFFEKIAHRFTASVSSAEVTVCLPETLAPAMRIQTASGDVCVESRSFPSLHIGTASGNVEVANTNVQGELRVTSASGDITLNNGSAKQLNLTSTSGDVEVNGFPVQGDVKMNTTSGDIGWYAQAQTVEVSTISGDITLEGSARSVSVKSVSGDTDMRLGGSDLQSVSGKTTSGDISLSLPAGTQADIHTNTVSGDISSNHAASVAGAAVSVSLSTVAGDISIN